MPVPVATSSTRSWREAAIASTNLRRQRGSCPSERIVATRSYDRAIPVKMRPASAATIPAESAPTIDRAAEPLAAGGSRLADMWVMTSSPMIGAGKLVCYVTRDEMQPAWMIQFLADRGWGTIWCGDG